MKVYLKKENLKTFSMLLSGLDDNLSTCVIMDSEKFNEKEMASFIESHIEVQNAIMMIKDIPDCNFDIFRSCCEDENEKYEKMLKNLFRNVMKVKSSNEEQRFTVSGCLNKAVDIFNNIVSCKKENDYLYLLNKHKKNVDYSNEYELYSIENIKEKRTFVEDDFLEWCAKASQINSYISLSVCGFTIEEIKKNQYLKNVFSLFHRIYILFCGKYSVGAYVLNEKRQK